MLFDVGVCRLVSLSKGGFEAGAVGFEGFDVGFFAEGEADVVEAFHEAPAGVVVDVEAVGVALAGDGAGFKVDGEFYSGVLF